MLTYKDWLRYIGKRLLMMIPVLIGVSMIIFLIMEFTPGDPVLRILGVEATPEDYAEMEAKLGLDKNFVERYFIYMRDLIFKFDMGISWRTGRPVIDEIAPRLPVSIRIAVLVVAVAVLWGIPAGIYSAVKQNSFGDNVLRVVATVMVAMPRFWLAMLLVLAFAMKMGILPAIDDGTWQSYILPVVCSAFPMGCSFLRLTRSSMLECIREDYVRTAKAKGVPSRTVVYKHALQNALLPVVTNVGASFGVILGGSIISEQVFSLQGMGQLMVLSIRANDTPTILSSVLMLAFFFSVVILVVDLLMAVIDPRVKAKIKKG